MSGAAWEVCKGYLQISRAASEKNGEGSPVSTDDITVVVDPLAPAKEALFRHLHPPLTTIPIISANIIRTNFGVALLKLALINGVDLQDLATKAGVKVGDLLQLFDGSISPGQIGDDELAIILQEITPKQLRERFPLPVVAAIAAVVVQKSNSNEHYTLVKGLVGDFLF